MLSVQIATLYVIGTPIGNLEDLTPRAKLVLSQLTHLVVEDTREAKKLLELSAISYNGKRFFSYGNHNLKEATELALNLLNEGHSVGLMTDRGMPGISDPGALLVARATEKEFKVIPIPGVSSITTAVSVSGIDGRTFHFMGFLSTRENKRLQELEQIRHSQSPVVILESPHRIRNTLKNLKQIPGTIFIARELTKQFETLTSSSLQSLDIESIPELGEFTLVVRPEAIVQNPDALQESIRLRLMPDKDWAKVIANRLGVAANEIYNALQRAKSAGIATAMKE